MAIFLLEGGKSAGMHFMANQKQASLESPQGFSIPLVINFATKTSHASILFDSISCSLRGLRGWQDDTAMLTVHTTPTSPNFIIEMMC